MILRKGRGFIDLGSGLGKAQRAVKNASYSEGQGDLVSRLMIGITRVTIWVIRVINLLTKSPCLQVSRDICHGWCVFVWVGSAVAFGNTSTDACGQHVCKPQTPKPLHQEFQSNLTRHERASQILYTDISLYYYVVASIFLPLSLNLNPKPYKTT